MVELGVVGAKNSGKTTMIEQLVRYLADEGIAVATVKHTSHTHRFDTPGKDSHRHRQAGASLTVVVSEAETAIFASPDQLQPTMIQEVTRGQFGVWLVEGDSEADRPKVLLTRNLDGLAKSIPSNVVATYGPVPVDAVDVHFDLDDVRGLSSFVTDTILAQGKEE